MLSFLGMRIRHDHEIAGMKPSVDSRGRRDESFGLISIMLYMVRDMRIPPDALLVRGCPLSGFMISPPFR